MSDPFTELLKIFGTHSTMPLDEDLNYAKRQLPDGRWLTVNPLTYGRARLNISSAFSPMFFDNGY